MPNLTYIALHGLWLSALALWLGGLAFAVFVAAPVTFETLPTRAEAGHLVGRMLRRFERFALPCLGLLAATGGAKFALFENPTPPILLRYALLFAAALAALISSLWLSPTLAELRARLDPIDAVPEEDPARRRFRTLHGLSMALSLLQLLLGAGVLFLS